MASASCSSTCIPTRELFCCSQVLHKGNRELGLSVDSKLPHMRPIGAPRNQLLFHGKTAHSLYFVKEKRLSSAWKDSVQLLGKSNFNGWSLGTQHTHLIKAVATCEPKCLVPSEKNGHECYSDLESGTNSYSQVFQSSNDGSSEMDERERLRRMRISKANKGNVPWNKGRKHSAETLRRIRERTKIAMQDPKVKMKLMNLGHAQSEETRVKIGVGVREGWQRRRERLMVQDTCFFEWQNMLAEASRKGYAGEDELQWDSYKILDKQLRQEWLESVEKRKTMPRPKGSKRAPKSPEQRRKISEAIHAKWADPEYRNRVYAALAKYHGTSIGVKRKERKKPIGETSSTNRVAVKKKSMQSKGINTEAKNTKKATPRKTRVAAPLYKDPMASSKLEMIKRIKAQRAAMETKKRKAIEKAKLLISEAEKAAKALEVAALKSPLARDSLLEARKLIAEATRSIESIENGQLRSQDTGDDDASSHSGVPMNYFQTSQGTPNSDTLSDRRPVNGSHLLSSSDYKDFNFDKFTLQNALSDREPLPTRESAENSGTVRGCLSPSLQPDNPREESSRTDLRMGQSKINGSIRYDNLPLKEEEDGTSLAKRAESPTASVTNTKKWVCGRLVEVEEG